MSQDQLNVQLHACVINDISAQILTDIRRLLEAGANPNWLNPNEGGVTTVELAASNRSTLSALQPFLDHVSLSDKKFGKVNKIYIECLQDNTIHIDDKRRMHQKLNYRVISLDCDHSPFFSCPEKLVRILADHSRAKMIVGSL
jgi:hypothetical protein